MGGQRRGGAGYCAGPGKVKREVFLEAWIMLAMAVVQTLPVEMLDKN